MTALTLRGVTKSFGAVEVLHGVDLDVPAQRLTAILGPSGCGKTTLLRLIAGFADPDSGTISFGDREVFRLGRSVSPQRRRVGYVPQEGALFPHLDVASNIAFGLPRSARRRGHRVDELLALVGLPSQVRTRLPHELSGGQQQRVALARALAPSPSVVLLDEPFASLDAGLREGTGRAVAEALSASKATAVLVTHDQGEALSLAHQVAVMRSGLLVQVASPREVYAAPVDIGVAQFVGAAVILPAELHGTTASSALGELTVDGGTTAGGDGAARVLVRPEQIVLGPTQDALGPLATVTDLSYFGHDSAVRLELASGAGQVTARLAGSDIPAVGDTVALSVVGPVTVYAASPDGQRGRFAVPPPG